MKRAFIEQPAEGLLQLAPFVRSQVQAMVNVANAEGASFSTQKVEDPRIEGGNGSQGEAPQRLFAGS
jgi:hypothetical protein